MSSRIGGPTLSIPTRPVTATVQGSAPADPWPAGVEKPSFYDYLPNSPYSCPYTKENLYAVIRHVAALFGFFFKREAHEGITCKLLLEKGVYLIDCSNTNAKGYISDQKRAQFVSKFAQRLLDKMNSPDSNGTVHSTSHYMPVGIHEALYEVYNEEGLETAGALIPYKALVAITIAVRDGHTHIKDDDLEIRVKIKLDGDECLKPWEKRNA